MGIGDWESGVGFSFSRRVHAARCLRGCRPPLPAALGTSGALAASGGLEWQLNRYVGVAVELPPHHVRTSMLGQTTSLAGPPAGFQDVPPSVVVVVVQFDLNRRTVKGKPGRPETRRLTGPRGSDILLLIHLSNSIGWQSGGKQAEFWRTQEEASSRVFLHRGYRPERWRTMASPSSRY